MSYSFLFGNNNSSSGNGIYSLLSEYNNIKSGTYYKVVKAYYAKQTAGAKGAKNTSNSKNASATQSETAKALNTTQKDAKALSDSAEALIKTGKNSVFEQKDITTKGEDGTETTTKGYDIDAIYNAVKKFTDNYNNLIDSGSKSASSKVRNQISNMTSSTQAYEKLLNNVGIKIGSDNKLSIDKEAFKAADMTTAKTLFNGNSSFAYSVSSRASSINFTAQSESNRSSLYNYNGNYKNSYSSGSLLNSFF